MWLQLGKQKVRQAAVTHEKSRVTGLPDQADSSPSSFRLFIAPFPSHPPRSPHPSTMVVGNRAEARTLLWLGARASTGNTPLLLLCTAEASQEHSLRFKCCSAPASSGVEHVYSFFREFMWCQPRTQLSI